MKYNLLWQLQKIDQTLANISREIKQKELILTLKEKQITINKLQETLDKENKEVEQIEIAAQKMETELKELETKKGQLEEKLYGGSLTFIKEIEGMQDKLGELQNIINQVEEKVFSLMDQAEDKTQIINKMQGELAQLKKEFAKGVKKYNKNKKTMEQQKDELEIRRQKIIDNLNQETLDKYQQLQKRFKNTGIAKVEGNSCSGCRIEIPVLQLRSIKKGDTIEYCEYCGRLLVREDWES